MQVTKKNGSLEELNIDKITAAAKFACRDLENVSPDDVVMSTTLKFFDGIPTSDIQNALIISAAQKVSEERNYTFVAARLMMMNNFKEVTGGSLRYPGLEKTIITGIEENRFDKRMLRFNMDDLNDAIVQERDSLFDFVGMSTLTERYLMRKEPLRDEKVGRLFELPQHFWMRVAMGLSLNFDSEEERTEAAIRYYDRLSSLEFVSSTPTLFNSGTNFSQMSSCYGNFVGDSLIDEGGIYPKMTECAALSKYAGGIGTCWTGVRSMGGHIRATNGRSSGIVPFLKVYNDTSVAVNQCFAPETLIYTSNGIKPISEVEPGVDLVLTGQGDYRAVEEKLDYNQEAPMLKVTLKHSIESTRVTDAHPYWAIKGVAPEQSIERTLKQIDSGKLSADWTPAGDLEVGDYIGITIPSEVVVAEGFDADIARLYGIMLGDGHVRKDGDKCREFGVSFNRDKGEKHLGFVTSLLEKLGVSYWITESKNSSLTQVRWTYNAKTEVGRDAETGRLTEKENQSCLPFGYEDLYNEQGDKFISPRLSHLPPNQAKAIVRGLIETDGCVSRGKEITFHNTSRVLVEGLRYQMLRFAVPTAGNMRYRNYDHETMRSDGSIARIKSSGVCYDLRIPAVDWLAKFFGVPALTKRNWFILADRVFTRVKSVEAIEEDKPQVVYDLRVDTVKSYTLTDGLVHNGGKRKGAFAAYLEPWHADALAFIDLKKKTGDERRRTHDIFPVFFMNDLFMKRKEDPEAIWSFFDPDECPELVESYGAEFERLYIEAEKAGKARHQINATELWQKIVLSVMTTGAPWLTFKDEHNRRNPQSHDGMIHNSNLCTEISLNNSTNETFVCNLGSINLSRMVVDGKIDFDLLGQAVSDAIEMLDNVIDLNYYPSDESRRSNMRHRPIGLGVMGYAEALVQCGIDYESEEHLKWADEVFEVISYHSIVSSSVLARTRGRYESFEGSLWSQGILPIDTARNRETNVYSAEAWDRVRELAKQGMRNCNLMAVAPTATIANIAGTTPCTEASEHRVFKKENIGGLYRVVEPCQQYNRPEITKTAYEISPEWQIRPAAVRQKWVDQSQSLNIYCKADTKGREVAAIYDLAWRLGLKSTYYLKKQKTSSAAKKVGA